MKRKSIVLLCLMAISLSLITPVAAKSGVVYKAKGSWDEYVPPEEHSELLSGQWSITIRSVDGDYVVKWHSIYRELNLGGEGALVHDQAVGTVDVFKYYFNEVYSVSLSDDSCVLEVVVLDRLA